MGKGSKEDKLFKMGLSSQFGKTRMGLQYHGSLDDFVRAELLGADTVWISCPNFVRESKEDNFGNKFYKNYAIRFKLDESDVVLMGDIFEGSGSKRTFRVKGITFMDSGLSHYGEMIVQGPAIWVQLQPKGIWESSSTTAARPNHIRDAEFLTDDTMLALQSMYVVKDPEGFERTANIWAEYLETRKQLIRKKEEKGYPISSVDVRKAYHLLPDMSVSAEDAPPFLKTDRKMGLWSYANTGGDERPLMHVCIDLPCPDDEELLRQIRKSISSFTRNPNRITWQGSKRDDYLALGDSRVSAPEIERIPPQDVIDEINNKLKRDIEQSNKGFDSQMDIEVRAAVRTFSDKVLPGILDDVRNAESEPVRRRIQQAADKAVDAQLSKARSDFDSEQKKAADRAKKALETWEKKYESWQKVQNEEDAGEGKSGAGTEPPAKPEEFVPGVVCPA